MTAVWHVTDKRNLDGILKDGLVSGRSLLGTDRARGIRQDATFFETRPIPAQPGDLVFLRLEVPDGDLFQIAATFPVDVDGRPTPPSWRGSWGTVAPGCIEAIATPPRNDAAHLACFIEGAERALAASGLPTALVDVQRGYAWRAVRQFEAITHATPWQAVLRLDRSVNWMFSKKSRYSLFLDAVEHHNMEMYRALGNDPDWRACLAGQLCWFNGGLDAARTALAYQERAYGS